MAINDWYAWCAEVEAALDGQEPAGEAATWLWREAYFDSYSIDEAIKLALDSSLTFSGQQRIVPRRRGKPIHPAVVKNDDE